MAPGAVQPQSGFTNPGDVGAHDSAPPPPNPVDDERVSTLIGIASWKAAHRGGSRGSCFEIGLALLPDYRGQGLGTTAQRLLVDYLFRFTTVHRLEAGTDTDNIAEQKALERIGFIREGVLREVAFRDGTWRNSVIYALLRKDWQQH